MGKMKKQSQKSCDHLKQTQLTAFFNFTKDVNSCIKQYKPKEIKKKVITILIPDTDSEDDCCQRQSKALEKPFERNTLQHALCVTKSTPLTKVKEKNIPRVLISKKAKDVRSDSISFENTSSVINHAIIKQSFGKDTELDVNSATAFQDVVHSLPCLLKRQLSPCASKSPKRISPPRNKLNKKLFDDYKTDPKGEKIIVELELETNSTLSESLKIEETVLDYNIFEDEINSQSVSISPKKPNLLSLKHGPIDDNKKRSKEEEIDFDLNKNSTMSNKSNASEETILNDFINVNLEEYGLFMEDLENSNNSIESKTIAKSLIRVKSGSQLFEKQNIINIKENVPDHPITSYTTKDIQLEDIPEDKTSLKNLIKMMKFVEDYPNLYSLLREEEQMRLGDFFKMSHNHQFVCFKLFTRLPKWYNLNQFLGLISLNIDTLNIDNFFDELKDSRFVITDYTTEEPIDLLNYLPLDAIKSIFSSFKIKSKKKMKKDDYITRILSNCNTQTTLTMAKRTDEILMDRISEKMGKCIKLENTFYNLLFRLHLLYSFANPEFIKPNELYSFMWEIQTKNKILPNYSIDYGKVFDSVEDFERFSKAIEFYNEYHLEKEKKKEENMIKIAKAVCLELENLLKLNLTENNDKPNYLKKLCAGRVFVNTLSIACDDLPTHSENVKRWLLLLLHQKRYCLSKRGKWFDHLALIEERYKKNTEQAAQILYEALCDPYVTIIDRNTINVRAKRLIMKKTDTAFGETVELLQQIIMASPDEKPFPFTITEASTKTRTQIGCKKYYMEGIENSQYFNLITVEEVAIKYYALNGYSYGLHCEGSLITSLFFLLFWDIIYETYVPGTFVTEIQYVPLDLKYTDFYTNRKELIDTRLNDVERNWSEEKFKSFFYNNMEEHSNKYSMVSMELIDYFAHNNGINCITRIVLSQILKRLVTNFGAFRAGMPDLFVWNPDTKKCKFVEVKGERDKLSMKQKLWLRYLLTVGADAEVCHVNTIGSRIKKRR